MELIVINIMEINYDSGSSEVQFVGERIEYSQVLIEEGLFLAFSNMQIWPISLGLQATAYLLILNMEQQQKIVTDYSLIMNEMLYATELYIYLFKFQ